MKYVDKDPIKDEEVRRGSDRLRVLSTLLVFCFVLSPIAGWAQSVADVVKTSGDAVVLIVVSDDSGKELKQGSGFIISAPFAAGSPVW
jgi:hypothetical protein